MKLFDQRDKQMILGVIGLSLILGIWTKDILIGGAAFATGLLCAYYAALGKKVTYFYGFVNYVLLGYIAFKNHLYGIFFFYLFLFAPLQIKGFFCWVRKQEEASITVKNFRFKNSILIVGGCILGSVLVGMLLDRLPGQQLAFMDATSNCINLCGIILLMLRFQESWWLWFINNVIDLIISIQCVMQHGANSMMMLMTAIGFLVMNIWGIICWRRLNKKHVET